MLKPGACFNTRVSEFRTKHQSFEAEVLLRPGSNNRVTERLMKRIWEAPRTPISSYKTVFWWAPCWWISSTWLPYPGTPLGLRMKAGGGERWGPHCSTGFARVLVEGGGEQLNTFGWYKTRLESYFLEANIILIKTQIIRWEEPMWRAAQRTPLVICGRA